MAKTDAVVAQAVSRSADSKLFNTGCHSATRECLLLVRVCLNLLERLDPDDEPGYSRARVAAHCNTALSPALSVLFDIAAPAPAAAAATSTVYIKFANVDSRSWSLPHVQLRFAGLPGGECDARSCYTALAVASNLGLAVQQLAERSGVVDYLRRCQVGQEGCRKWAVKFCVGSVGQWAL